MERNGILTPARILMDPENIIIREESRTKVLYIFIFPLYISRRIKSIKTENRLVFVRITGDRQGNTEWLLLIGTGFLGRMFTSCTPL